LPKLAPRTFQHKASRRKANERSITKQKIVLFVDEFCNYYDVTVAEDAQDLLTILGYEVQLIMGLDSARALLSKGFLEEAKVEIDANINTLKDLVSIGIPLLGLEPSAILGFRDEYIRLATDKKAAVKLSNCAFLVEEFLASEIEKGNIDATVFTSEEKKIKIHVHCHQKALSNTKVTFDVLNLPLNYKPTIINAGCCGMAGSFGYEKEHYEVSMAIGEQRLFPAVRKSAENTIIVANGTSCRHQIKEGAMRLSKHPISVLREALII
ncbi:MAG: FAD-binding oxidoreductase, partial [Bacteroidetes bacterium]|nr:FAD-binding oxidoreductase [Bacteroidota bacterium]